MKQHYYLYLDESGDFTHDPEMKRRKNNSPSLIGGILLTQTVSNSTLKNLFGGKDHHATNELEDDIFSKFEKIDGMIKPLYIIFSNEERIKVINNNLTYQNIMAEGIIQLLEKLKSEEPSGEIFLDIQIAQRLIVPDDRPRHENQGYVSYDTYVERIQERLIMAANRSSAAILPADWKITIGDAIKDDMLKIADIVCHTYLTRNTKFEHEKYQKIRDRYADKTRTYVFSVFQSSLTHIFQEAMADGRIGEAVTFLCQHDDHALIEQHMENVRDRLQSISADDLQIQYKFISAFVEHFLNVERDYNKSILLLRNLLHYFLPVLENIEKNKNLVLRFKLDLNFYLLTVYTHNGNVYESIACENTCDDLIHNLPYSLDMVDYRIKYMNRKIINQINQFSFLSAAEDCRKLIEQCEQVKDLLSFMTDQEFTYPELGKAYSNLVQANTFLLRENRSLYSSTIDASDLAISEMNHDARQYLYRTVLETEAGYYDKAFLALAIASERLTASEVDMESGACASIKTANDKKQLCKSMINNLSCSKHIYLITNYIRLMAEGKAGKWDFSDVMYECYNSSDVCRELSGSIRQRQHPYEIIYWKLASYLSSINSCNAAVENYDKALEICFSCENTITMKYIGFAIELEQYAFSLKRNDKAARKKRSSLENHYQELTSDHIPDTMKELFAGFKSNLEDWEYYYNLSRKITY